MPLPKPEASGRRAPAGGAPARRRRERIPHVDGAGAVGDRLRTARTAACLSQRELAFAGCSAAYISRIERGERVPSLQVLRELARRCEVSEAYLAWGRDDLDESVSRELRALREARTRPELLAAYEALGQAAARAARELAT
jgi:transcriptional regulator with XRE-family HTH domain